MSMDELVRPMELDGIGFQTILTEMQIVDRWI
jgi:hypothetical protein